MQKLAAFIALGTTALVGCVAESGPDVTTAALAVTVVDGDTDCAAQGLGTHQLRIDAPVDGVYALDAGNTLLFKYYDDTNTVFFYTQSSLRMDGVLVHSGGETTVWELPEVNGWPSLGALDGSGGYAPTEAVTFCWDYELFLNPNGYVHTGLVQDWEIAKTGEDAALLLTADSSAEVSYTVTVTPTTTTAIAGMLVEGPVFVNNPTPYSPEIEAVTVMVGEVAATVTCPVSLPHTLAPFSILTCSFEANLPDTADREIYVDVVSDGTVAVDRSLETVSITDHTASVDVVDECVTVYDDHVDGSVLGTVCAGDGAATFTYTNWVGPFGVCGPFEVVNTAWFEGADTTTGDSASWTVGGEVPCGGGCTLTPGYWKTHSEHGPAPYDATWAELPDGADTAFFLSGQTYHQVLWTAPQGNAYYILAHAYIAAELNGIAGASDDAVAAELEAAEALLATYAPTSLALKSKAVRPLFIDLAAALDAYNNGLTGPGHCSE